MGKCIVWKESAEEQRVHYEIKPALGRLLSLTNVGGHLEAIATILESDPVRGTDRAFLAGITMQEDGTITFDIIVAPKATGSEEPSDA